MKRLSFLLAILALTAVSCKEQAPKLTALMGGPCSDCIVVEYPTDIAAESLTPETFTVADREIACAFVCDKNPAEFCGKAEPCKKDEACDKAEPCEKAEACCKDKEECKDKEACCKDKEECKDKEACCKEKECKDKEDCCKEEKDCCKEKEACCEEGKDCCKEKKACSKEPVNGKFVILVLKRACPEAKPCEKAEACAEEKACPEEKACEKEACAEEKACEEKKACAEKPEIKIDVQQVKDLTAVSGKAVKAWKAAVPVTEIICLARPCKGHHHDCKPERTECEAAPQE